MSSNMRALGLIIITLLLLTAGEGTAARKRYNIASLDLLFQEIFLHLLINDIMYYLLANTKTAGQYGLWL